MTTSRISLEIFNSYLKVECLWIVHVCLDIEGQTHDLVDSFEMDIYKCVHSGSEQQLDTDLIDKLNIVSLLEFYINYLAKKKYKHLLIHNITFCKY